VCRAKEEKRKEGLRKASPNSLLRILNQGEDDLYKEVKDFGAGQGETEVNGEAKRHFQMSHKQL